VQALHYNQRAIISVKDLTFSLTFVYSQPRTGPPTPPRHRRTLPERPVSQFVTSSRITNQQDADAVSALISGLTLDTNDNGHYIPMDTGTKPSPVITRRKPPPPPKTQGETVAVNVRASIAISTPSGITSSTFGHGPKQG